MSHSVSSPKQCGGFAPDARDTQRCTAPPAISQQYSLPRLHMPCLHVPACAPAACGPFGVATAATAADVAAGAVVATAMAVAASSASFPPDDDVCKRGHPARRKMKRN